MSGIGTAIDPSDWRVSDGRLVRTDRATRKDVVLATFCDRDIDTEERRKILDFVVFACKSHAGLVKALRVLVNECPKEITLANAKLELAKASFKE